MPWGPTQCANGLHRRFVKRVRVVLVFNSLLKQCWIRAVNSISHCRLPVHVAIESPYQY